ncbi:MAG: alanine--tRNA ligase, partial [Lachnospiraceae bacterium]|nr:alanine--tRNA ligase [Lachnospiraceae bacterium]
GVRRIEAITWEGVFRYYQNLEKQLAEAAMIVKATPATLIDKLSHMMAEIKDLSSENESLKSKLAQDSLGDVTDQVTEVKGMKFLAASVADVDMNGLRELGDQMKNQLGEGVVVLAASMDGKVNLVVMATEEAVKKGAHAGNLIKAIAPCVGGGGGGRPNMAQAGGKNPAGIDEALKLAKETVETQLA